MTTKCSYSGSYFDEQSGTEKQFKCTESALKSSYCKFHDENYLTSTTSEDVEILFIEKVEKAIQSSKPFVCLGYRLPNINLSGKEFPAPVYFSDTIFQGNTNFSEIIFRDSVFFDKTKFEGKANFVGTKFKNFCKFSECIFEDESNFLVCNFNKKAIFQFNNLNINSFSLSKFSDVTFFENIFLISSFQRSKFYGETLFQKNIFNDKADFIDSQYTQETSFLNNMFLGHTNFRNIHFKDNAEIHFEGSLSTVSLLNTDISKIIFGHDVSWEIQYENPSTIIQKIRIKFQKLININNKFKIQDEKIIENKSEYEISLESLLNEYRGLRENFDKHLRYNDAGEFFVREHEIKRKFKKNPTKQPSVFQPLIKQKNILARVFTILAFYYFIGKYGESYHRPIKIAIPGLIFSTFYFWSNGFKNLDTLFNNLIWTDPILPIMRSISAFFPLFGFDSSHAISDLLLRLALLPITAALFIALRRKLERKYRH